ncbi:hypothetical protein [Variovorax sp. RCC_210]|jgi:hypothetical protein|uniref:hypothetical protein n=1 Tax=Variovorax sp. RCC_210 TaxID=3239217 RepID=UPI0035244830
MSDPEGLFDQARAMALQNHQIGTAQSQMGRMLGAIDAIEAQQHARGQAIDELFAMAASASSSASIHFEVDEEDLSLVAKEEACAPRLQSTGIRALPLLDRMDVTRTTTWQDYLAQADAYAGLHRIEFGKDPFKDLMSTSQRIALEKRIKEEFTLQGAQCDKYDYMIAGTCGVIGGLIDVFFVGVPLTGSLTKIADTFTDTAVRKIAAFCGWNGPREGSDATASAIGFLENRFKVNYDHRHGGDVDGAFKMSASNHHLKSLGHSPDLVGLFFSILDQFQSTAHFVDAGQLICVDTETFELHGTTFVAKVFAGFVNWLGHLCSDMAGSSGAKLRGSGIPIPFFSLLQFVELGEFGQHRQAFSKIAVQVFEKGYDMRHGMAMAVPMLVTELLTRMMWVFKRRFYHGHAWGKCMPSGSQPELRRMLLVGHGTLCVIDVADAALRSGGDAIQFLLRSNLIAWVRFGVLSLNELRAWLSSGGLDTDAVEQYLEDEVARLSA